MCLINSHHCPAEEGNAQHHGPAGNDAESPEDIGHGHGDAVLGKLAVKGVEVSVLLLELALVLAGLVELNVIVWVRGGQVHALHPNIDRRGLGEELQQPDSAGAGGPGIAKDRLVIAVYVANMRRIWEGSDLGGGLVEGGLDTATVAYVVEVSLMGECGIVPL